MERNKVVKRFAVFAYQSSRRDTGGWHDFQDSFDNMGEAYEHMDDLRDAYAFVHCVDLFQGRIIKEL